MPDEHGEQCRESRVDAHGRLLSQMVLYMVRGVRCEAESETNEEVAEAMEYLVDGIVQLALVHENPRQIIEGVVHRLDSYPIEEIVRRYEEISKREG